MGARWRTAASSWRLARLLPPPLHSAAWHLPRPAHLLGKVQHLKVLCLREHATTCSPVLHVTNFACLPVSRQCCHSVATHTKLLCRSGDSCITYARFWDDSQPVSLVTHEADAPLASWSSCCRSWPLRDAGSCKALTSTVHWGLSSLRELQAPAATGCRLPTDAGN